MRRSLQWENHLKKQAHTLHIQCKLDERQKCQVSFSCCDTFMIRPNTYIKPYVWATIFRYLWLWLRDDIILQSGQANNRSVTSNTCRAVELFLLHIVWLHSESLLVCYPWYSFHVQEVQDVKDSKPVKLLWFCGCHVLWPFMAQPNWTLHNVECEWEIIIAFITGAVVASPISILIL